MSKVSVIITTYKRADTLRRAIISAATQTYSDVEVIVVNDNGIESPQNLKTRTLVNDLAQYLPNIIYIEHQANRNGAAARNTGLRVASGEYITFLDDDDIFSRNRIEVLMRVFRENLNTHLAYSAVGFAQGNKITRLLYPVEYDDHVYQLLKQNSFFGTGSNFLCKTDFVRAIGGFNEAFTRHQDMEFLIRYLTRYPNVLHVGEVLVIKTVANTSNAPDFPSFLEIKRLFLGEFQNLISEYGAEEQSEIRKANVGEIVSTAGVTKDWRFLTFLRSTDKILGDDKIELLSHLGKWLILQFPGILTLLRWRFIYRARLLDRRLADGKGMQMSADILTGVDYFEGVK